METVTRIDELIDRWEDMRDRGTPLTVEDLCAGCPELIPEVRRRIEALRAMDSALQTNMQETPTTTWDRGRRDSGRDGEVPEVLRATAVYRPRSRHGGGGLGVIFTADQEELGRTVALKRIRPDRLREVSRRRFLREAAITARLQHPGIVPIYGLGQDSGGPFYTMPLIRGQTLQEAIEAFHGDESLARDPGRRRLRLRELLQSFVAACNTVAYAHDQGVVHRDLKPSNLMLGPYGETLVLDWGLAKRFGGVEATSEDGGEGPSPEGPSDEVTATGEVLGTPQFMSPEQARGEPAGPASDIFSLGLVLYAILTGESAFDLEKVRGPDRLQAVREAAIVPPRARDPRLPRAMEAVCLKALAPRAEDRYASARDLADDVTRWLADEPVTAWREPVSMRARRWARRHRTAVAALLAALTVGTVGLGAVVGVQAKSNARLKVALSESEESRKQAEAVRLFLVEAFRSPDPSQDGREVKVADVLDRAAARLDRGFTGSRATEGTLLSTLGLTYLGLGLYDRGVSLLTRARAVREAALGPDHPETLKGRHYLAIAYQDIGRTDEAIRLHEETIELQQAKLGPDHLDTLESRNRLAISLQAAGRAPEAIALLEENAKRFETKLGPDDVATLNTRYSLAVAYYSAGRPGEAIALHEPTLKRREAKLGPDHLDTLRSRLSLATALWAAGRTSDAIALHEPTLKLYQAKLGPDHPETLMSRTNLAAAYCDAGRLPEAIALNEGTLKLYVAKLGPDHPETFRSRDNLAAAYHNAGRILDAIPLHEDSLEWKEGRLGPDHPETLIGRNNLALAYAVAGRSSEAMAMHRTTLERCLTKLGPDHPLTLTSRNNLAGIAEAAGRLLEAIPLFEVALELRKAKLGPDHPETLDTSRGLAFCYGEVGRFAAAEGLYRELLARRRKTAPPDSPLLADDLASFGEGLLKQARWSEGESLLRECLAIRERANPNDVSRYEAMSLLGAALMGQGRHVDAEPLLVAGYEGMKEREAKTTVPDRSPFRQAAERVIHLYETWDRPEEASAWKRKTGMPDLPAVVFARP